MSRLQSEITPSHPLAGDDAFSWPVIGAALASFVALFITTYEFWGIALLAGLLVFSRFVPWRLPRGRVLNWIIRAGMVIVLVTLVGIPSIEDTTVWYLKREDTNLAGILLAGELTLRAWQSRNRAGVREGRGVALLLSACILAAATDTYRREPTQIITPVYLLFLLLSLRSFAHLGQPFAGKARPRKVLISLRAVIVLLVLVAGFTSVYLVTSFEYNLVRWARMFDHQRGRRAEIGFSTAPRLAGVFNPTPTLSRVLLIDGMLPEAHLRVMAFDTYSKQQWVPALSDRAFKSVDLKEHQHQPHEIQLTFTRLSDTAGLLPLPLETAGVNAADALAMDESGTVQDNGTAGNPPYQVVESTSQEFQGVLCGAPSETERKHLLEIPPEIDPKVTALALRVAGDGSPARQLFRIQQHLRNHHQYSLSFQPRGEPLNDFILNNRAAHCQYFASAVVVMARATGIPARFVNGFYAHESYGLGQTVVRQHDAHAWAECWVDGVGWTTVDATPSGGRPDGMFQDPPQWRHWWERLTDLPGKIRDWIYGSKRLLLWIAGGIGVVALLYEIMRRLRDRRRIKKILPVRYAPAIAELMEVSRRFESWLKRQGKSCPPEQTWHDHLAGVNMTTNESVMPGEARTRAQSKYPVRDSTTASFVHAYDEARFGTGDPKIVARAKELLKELESTDVT